MIIRPFQNGDEEGIRDLFKICFGRDMSHDEWVWKYKNSYLGSSSAVAEEEGMIIAHYGGLKMSFYCKGRIFRAYQGCDAMTHPQYRSRGVIVKTANVFYEQHSGMDFMFGFPSETHARLSERYLGWGKYGFVNEISKDIKSLKPQRFGWKVETGWSSIKAEEIDGLWDKIKDLRNLTVEKKSDYIFWRYRDNPCRQYQLLLFKGYLTKALKAYAVVLKHEDELRVIELISASEKIRKVIGFLEHLAFEERMNKIRLWMNLQVPEYKELKYAGYREDKGVPYAIKPFGSASPSPADFLDNYNYSMGDYDAA